MSIENKKENGMEEINEALGNVSGGGLRESTEKYGPFKLRKRKIYEVTRDDTGEVIKSFRNLQEANDLDNYMNTNKRYR